MIKFRGRARRGEGNTDLSAKLAAESAPGYKLYDVWVGDEIIDALTAPSFGTALEDAVALHGKRAWVVLRVSR